MDVDRVKDLGPCKGIYKDRDINADIEVWGHIRA